MNHTPGPWHTSAASRAIANAAGWDIATLPEYRGPIGIDETTANARLIAAAPDLLAALKNLRDEALKINDYAQDVDLDNAVGEAITAIAEAEGRT